MGEIRPHGLAHLSIWRKMPIRSRKVIHIFSENNIKTHGFKNYLKYIFTFIIFYLYVQLS